jgi:hypothetical protein
MNKPEEARNSVPTCRHAARFSLIDLDSDASSVSRLSCLARCASPHRSVKSSKPRRSAGIGQNRSATRCKSSPISRCEGEFHVQSGMASVSWFGARIACFVETLQLRKNADLRLVVLSCGVFVIKRSRGAHRACFRVEMTVKIVPDSAGDLIVNVRQ